MSGQTEEVCGSEVENAGSGALPVTRPRRGAADRTMQRIRGIQEWESASETSQLFKRVAESIDKEFSRESSLRKKQRVDTPADAKAEESEEAEEESDDENDSSDPDNSDDEDEQMTAEDRAFVVSDEDEVDDEAEYVPGSEPECSEASDTESEAEDSEGENWSVDENVEGSCEEEADVPELKRESTQL